jgi:protein-L-isoaspartate O-methyltransferase
LEEVAHPHKQECLGKFSVEITEQLKEQLAPGGKLVIPLTSRGKQSLHVIEKTSTGYKDNKIEDACFVPLLPGLG